MSEKNGSTRRVVAALAVCVGALAAPAAAQPPTPAEIDAAVAALEEQVIAWRRDLHAHPELGNREFRTAEKVAEHLRALGFDRVDTGVAHTGVVGVLVGGRPGPVVALRADMDGLPVTEQADLPFASRVRTEYQGEEVGVMHACGHDVHTSVLMGAASVLAGFRERLPGTVKLIFQPAEEGPPPGERGGAELMIEEGVLEDPVPGAIFGLHAWPVEVGTLGYRPGGTMAGAAGLKIVVRGRQTHGAEPWNGIDPIVAAAQIVMGLQTIASRQVDARAPVVVTVGSIHGGNRGNIIPDDVVMEGTIRVLEPDLTQDVHDRVRHTAERIAEAAGASAEVEIDGYAPVTYNDPDLTRRMAPTLERAAGPGGATVIPPVMPSEDFAYFQERVPGLYFFLGVNAAGVSPQEAAPNHSPFFFANEDALRVGVRAMASLAIDYLAGAGE